MFYGWKIVTALFVILAFSSGLGFYNHSVVLQALASEKGFAITMASTAVSIFFMASGVAGIFIAALLEKYDVRLVVSGGAILASVCLGSIGAVTTEGQLLSCIPCLASVSAPRACYRRPPWWPAGSTPSGRGPWLSPPPACQWVGLS